MAALAMVDAKKRKAMEEESMIREAPAASCCSSNGSSELVKEQVVEFMDLEVNLRIAETQLSCFSDEEAGSEVETCYCRRERETSRSVGEESEVVESRGRTEKFPSESELEDFFAVHEKQIQKRFADKYNYDIGKDKPLEQGRYHWVRFNPCTCRTRTRTT